MVEEEDVSVVLEVELEVEVEVEVDVEVEGLLVPEEVLEESEVLFEDILEARGVNCVPGWLV